MISTKRKPHRRGVILLIALGMLALFGILTAAFLTFASDSRQAAFSSARKEFRSPRPEELIHAAFLQVLAGTTDRQSALFRHDILGDYYGYHSEAMGVVDELSERHRVTALPTAALTDGMGPWRDRGVLWAGANVIKVPVRFDDPQPAGSSANAFENINNTANASSPLNLDDALAGRTLSFLEGPLAGHTVRIVRWAGFRPTSGQGSGELSFRYSLFVDLGDPSLPSSVVLGDGSVHRLQDILHPSSGANSFLPACLFYSAGANGSFGSPGNDDGDGVTNNPSEAGWPGSDDVPFQLAINPIPRNGSGNGVDPTDPSKVIVDATGHAQLTIQSPAAPAAPRASVTLPLSLQPNYSRWWSGELIKGNVDEPYDAPDYENMFLSSVQGGDGFDTRIIPSFHRPALINYLLNAGGYNLSSPTDDQMRVLAESIRRATLRPLPFHDSQAFGGSHPRFTGGNPSFILRSPNRLNGPADVSRLHLLANALINGPWDVDNDNDGTPDSVWIDPNLPVVTAPDGTMVRPLIAVQVEDLGSKFNLNTHGNPAQLTNTYLQRFNGPLAGKLGLNGMSTAVSMPSGRGYGPAEIFPLLDVASIDSSNASNASFGRLESGSDLFNLLDALLASKYSPGSGREVPNWTTMGTVPDWQRPPSQQPGIRGMVPGTLANDVHDQRLHPEYPRVQTRDSRFGFPIDTYGRGGLAIDASGNLLSSAAGVPLLYDPNTSTSYMDEALNDPYEFDPTGRLAGDRAYTMHELAGLFNRRRWDQHLSPSRLETAINNSISADPTIASIVTTYSSSDVHPSSLRIPELRDDASSRVQQLSSTLASTVPSPLMETLLARVIDEGTITRPIDANDILLAETLLAPELRMGMPIDLNRPFGNGLDDNGNGYIDDAKEFADGIDDDGNGTIDDNAELESTYGGASQTPRYNRSPITPVGPAFQPESARQALARHIYCAAMLLATDESESNIAQRWIADTTNLSDADDQRDFRARRIAQWAVNVVDYRDSDSILTRFVYDDDPLNGWDTDPTTNADEVGEVWGCEHPELLFMESLAFHNLRVKDTKLDDTGENMQDGDPNVDQIRMPQGSAFLELYSPRPRTTVTVANHESLPEELYDTSGAIPVLDLDRMAPAGPGTPSVPVWRIAISEPHILDKEPSPLVQREDFPDTTSFDPSQSDELDLNAAPDELDLDRFVVFSHYADRAAVIPLATEYGVDPSAIFSNLTNGSTNLPLGTYMNIAPRTETRLGSLTDTGVPTAPSNQRFEMVADDGLVHFDATNARTTPDPADANDGVQQSLVFLAQTFEPLAWGMLSAQDREELFGPGNMGIGFNISEPLPGTSYYRLPEDYLMGQMGDFPLRDAYWDYSTSTSENPNFKPRDLPADLEQLDETYPIGELTFAYTQDPDSDTPFLGHEPNYRTAYLQRLADPTLPFQDDPNQPNYNPYRTIDWISMDLTVFSGDEAEDKIVDDVDYITSSRERTGEDRTSTPQNLLFANRVNDPTTKKLGPAVAGQPYFNLLIEQTLSYLNTPFGPRHTAATVGAFTDYIGQPQTMPFALHPWLNRPYDSPLELMFVPACSQGRLFEEFTLAKEDLYEADDRDEFYAAFGHLMNFFDSSQGTDERSDLFRIFDLVGTGTKFRGSSDPTSPLLTSGTLNTTTTGAAAARDYWRQLMAFPFNQFPTFREHGRLNLNTIGDQRVFAGLMWGHLPATERASLASTQWQEFAAARRGFTPSGMNAVTSGPPPYSYAEHLHPKYPTEFAARMTHTFAADYAPELDTYDGSAEDRLRKPAITGSLLRPKPDAAGDGFEPDAPLFARTTTGPHDNVDRNAIMRYQTLTRLSNLTTNHSNAYVVRITMGYFEVDPSTGFLGREYLSELGRNERYRAMYVIDRSIPVHYVPGATPDAERVILYQRFYRE